MNFFCTCAGAAYAILLRLHNSSASRMSRREQTPRGIARQTIASCIAQLKAGKTTPSGLPEAILIHALEGYGDADLVWAQISSRARKFYSYVSAQISDCTLRRAFQPPIGTKKVPAAAISIFRLSAAPLRYSETLFNANIYTFVFRP